MLQNFLEKLCNELSIHPVPKLNENNAYSLHLGEDLISLKSLDPGVSMHSRICICPAKKKEELFMHLMRANLLGQGTNDARIGLDQDEKHLTLSLHLSYELNYQTFKDTIEDFANYLIYWRDMIAKFENEQSIY